MLSATANVMNKVMKNFRLLVCLRGLLGSAQGLLLALQSGITPDSLRGQAVRN